MTLRPSTVAFLNPVANDGGNATARLARSIKEQFPGVVIVDDPVPNAGKRHRQWAELLNGLQPSRVIIAGGDGTTTEVMSVLMNLENRTVSRFAEVDELSPPKWLKKVSGIHGTGSAGDYDKTIGFPVLSELAAAMNEDATDVLPLGMAWALMPTATPGQFDPQVISHSLTAGFVAEHVFARRDTALQKWRDQKEPSAPEDFAMARAFRDTLALISESFGNRDIPWHLEKVRGRVLCFLEALCQTIQSRMTPTSLGFEASVDPLEHFDVKVTKNANAPIHLQNVIDVDLFGLLMAAGGVGIPEAFPIAGPNFRMTLAAVPNNMTLGVLMAIEGATRGSLAKLGCTSLIGPGSHFWTVQGAVNYGVMPPGHFQTLTHGDHVTIDFSRQRDGQHQPLPVQVLRNGDVLPHATQLRIAVGRPHQALPFVASKKSPLARVATSVRRGPSQHPLLTRRTP